MRQIDIFITGKPCAGKDTIASHICDEFGFVHFKPGPYLKNIYEKEYGAESQFMKDFYAGALKNSEDGAKKIISHVEDDLGSNLSIVYAGYPRTLEQWEMHLKLSDKRKNSLKIFLVLQLSDEAALARCSKRYLCLSCERPQHTSSEDPLTKCIFCYSENVERRVDDTQDNLKQRLKYYKEKTAALENLESNPEKKLNVHKIVVEGKGTDELAASVDKIIGQYYGS